MSDSDSDVPDLIDSSDEDNPESESRLTAAQHAARWLEKKEAFLGQQELWNRVFCLGPFLFGVNNIIAAAWIKALSNAKLILNESRQFQITFLEWQEWECVDLVDHAIQVVHKNLRDKETLSKVIDLVHRLEDCKSGVVIDVDLAIEEAEKVTQIADIWRDILSSKLSQGKEKAAKFAVLYIVKIYREHVLKLEADFVEITLDIVKTQNNSTHADEYRKKGNDLYANSDYVQSVELYTKAAKQDPFCHIYYGNRAQAYHKLDRYMEALADGRRAVTIKPDFPKGHFRYVKAFHQLGRLGCAIQGIKVGLEQCKLTAESKGQHFEDHVNQLNDTLIQYKKEDEEKRLLTPIPDKLNERLNVKSPDDVNTDITDMLGIKGPPSKKHSGDFSMFNSTGDRDSTKERKSSNEKDKKKLKKKKQGEDDKKKRDQEEYREYQRAQAEAVSAAKRKEEEEKKEFELYLEAGSAAIKADNPNGPKIAMSNYRKALDMVVTEDKMKMFDIDDVELVTLKYALAISAVRTGLFKNITEGIEKFQDIIDNHQDIRFPLAYYGLGKAYVALFRFSDAIEPLQDGKTIARNITYVQVTWPGTHNKIPENESSELLFQIKELIQLCKLPPVPEATCRHHTDKADSRLAIYINEPGFKGYIKIVCQVNCVIPFHMTCWKTYKQGLNKVADKDVLDSMCPTPDCAGFIMKLEVIRPDGIPREFTSLKYTALKEVNKSKKPAVKQKSTSETKMVKKQEKKEIRKLKKKQKLGETTDTVDNNEDGNVITDGASAVAFIEEVETQHLPALKDTTVLKKEDVESQKNNSTVGKNKRSRKKKDKSKQILNVEVNFSDRKEDNLLNENSVVSDDEESSSKTRTPFSVPSELKSQINSFEKNYQGNAKPLFQPDEITENLFSYFGDILHANGPLAVDDTKIQQELEVFPPEALDRVKQVGGLCDFLKQSLKFAVIDDVISLLSDAKRAREIALLRRSERDSNSAPVIVPVNAWTTVGKSTNNVDSLKQSILKSQGSSKPPTITTSGLVNSSSSSSLVSIGSDSVNLSQNLSKPLSNGFSESGTPLNGKKETKKSSGVDNLDSIDDFPSLISTLPKTKKQQVEELNDLDAMSDPDSDKGVPYPNKGSFDDRLEITLSRSSSHSDLSEKSSRSDFSSDLRPKPLRPLGVEKIGPGKKLPSLSANWDKLESDFDSSWNKVKKEEFEHGEQSKSGFGSVGLELKQATEDFVRKSDEKFVSELAESVVDKLYHGKTVTETERQNTLNRVSSDIWKDFEKSANSGQLRGPGLWADTPVGQDYSTNLGKFASDFMKKHYEKSGESTFSPTSTLTSPFPKTANSSSTLTSSFPQTVNSSSTLTSPFPQTVNSSFTLTSPFPQTVNSSSSLTSPFPQTVKSSLESNLPATNTAISSSWSSTDTSDLSKTSFDSFFSVPLFGSGSTWGFDTFESNSPTSPLMQRVIRPPQSVTSYYQRAQTPPTSAPGAPLQQPQSKDFSNFTPPFFANVRMPPPQSSFPSPHPGHTRLEKREIEIQVTPETCTVSVMTDAYEPFKAEFLKAKQDMDEIVKLMSDNKVAYDNLALELKKKEKAIQELESNIRNKDSVYDYEKKNWINEKKAYGDKIRELQFQLESKEKLERELQDRMQGQEKKVNELAVLANDQRTKDLGEIKKLLEKTEQCQKDIEIQTKRAMVAEIELVRTKFTTTKGFLERSQKEATYHHQHLSAQVSKLKEDSKSIPPVLQQTLEYWRVVLQKSEENLTKLKADTDIQISEIQNGKSLAEQSPLKVENHPPMPETVKAYMIGAAGQMMMQRSQQQQQQVRPPISAAGAAGNGPVMPKPTAVSPVPPKPLTRIGSVAPGLVPPRPLSTLRSPLSVPMKPSPLRPLRMQQPVTSFEKLMMRLSATFPNHTRLQFNTLIQELRQAKGGSLSGMTMEDIISMVGEKIGQKRTASPLSQTPASRPMGPPPGLNKSWAFTASGLSDHPGGLGVQRIEMFQEEEDPCVICHEEMLSQPAVTLECNHTFHDECIRKWFQEQSTCPNCRVHTLLSDEFPSLNG